MGENHIKYQALKSLFWRYFERTGAQIVKFIVEITLARLLEPSVFGAIALVTVFTNILEIFIDSGFGTALIQKREPDDLDYSTVFYFNMVVCVVLYLAMFAASPYISAFYKNPDLTSVIRVISITLLISGLKNVQQAYVAKHMQFRKFFFATLGGTILAAIVGIFLAYKGFEIWALVAQTVINPAIDTVILWFAVSWRPKRMFSFERLKSLFDYGWKLLVGALVNRCQIEIQQLIIGRVYTPAELAFYNRGQVFPNTIVSNIDSSMNSVLLPVYSSEQDDKNKVKAMVSRSIKMSTYFIAPLIIGLAATSESVVSIVIGDKWLKCVPYLLVFCFIYLFYPVHTVNLSALRAVGRSDITLSIGILKSAISLVVLLFTFRFGIMAIALGQAATSLSSQIINSWPNKLLLDYGYKQQIADVLPNLVISCFMGVAVFYIGKLPLNNVLLLCIQGLTGIFLYLFRKRQIVSVYS